MGLGDLSLNEAKAHCRDPESSSRTCSEKTKADIPGMWFDGYTEVVP